MERSAYPEEEQRAMHMLSADFDKDWEDFHEKEWDPFIERHQTYVIPSLLD
jgi:hypothetical protein